jgi:hypothetical protein
MRKFAVAMAVLAAWCSTAWAVVDTTITVTDKSGKPLAEASVSLTRVDKKPAPQPKTAKTDREGKITVTHDEKDKNDKAALIVGVKTKEGATFTTRTTVGATLTNTTVAVEQGARTAQPRRDELAQRRPTETSQQPRPQVSLGTTYPTLSNPFSISLSGGPSWSRYSSTYRSNGVQAPFDASAHANGGDLCGGVNGYWPIPGTIFEYGGGVNVCGDFTGTTTLFDIIRHGLTGHVTATIDPGARVEPYIGVHAVFSDPAKTQAYLRMGPVFAHNKLTIDSNQVPGGGKFESASDSYWATGFGLQTGLSWPLCSNCIFGLPLSGGIGGKFAWYPGSHSVSVQSSVFGFTETATVDHVRQYAVIGTLSVPFGMIQRNFVP